LQAGGAPALPARTTSFQTWAERLLEHGQTLGDRELDVWLAQRRRASGRLPVDLPGGENTVGSAEKIEVSLGIDETRALLQEVPTAYRTRIQEALLAALGLAASRWTGVRALRVDLEGHGREEILPEVDLSRTVGWFTALFPVLLDLGQAADPGEALKVVKECHRSISQQGVGYGLLRYLHADPDVRARLSALPQAELLFNYWGQLDRVLAEGALLRAASEPAEGLVSPRARRSHLLEVNCSILDERLRMVWTYSRNLHRRSTIEAWAHGYAEALRSILAHCRSAGAGGVTPSDFPLASLDQRQLDKLVRKLSRARS
ncbi:MAG TPA: condensation domain-containing protein, partial [Thermoanaerobaculia bacterium]|nr:condensation domain-containing protein [Thermoanaerobaculia bacterium]